MSTCMICDKCGGFYSSSAEGAATGTATVYVTEGGRRMPRDVARDECPECVKGANVSNTVYHPNLLMIDSRKGE